MIPDPFFTHPKDPAQRVSALCAAVRRLAKFNPVAVLILTGDPRGRDAAEVRDIVVGGLRQAAEVAAEAGVTLGLKPLRQTSGTMVTTLPEAAALIEEVGAPNVAVIADIWHCWDLPNLDQDLRDSIDRLIGVEVNDDRNPTSSWCDRVLPGDGVARLPAILRVLGSAGFDGWYDLEIFSDNGAFGNDYPDSLWKIEPPELARRGVQTFRAVWQHA